MAAYSQVVSSTLELFGIAPSNVWDAWNWDEFTWGEGTADLITVTTKVLDSTVIPDSDVVKSSVKVIDTELVVTGDMNSESLRDGNGYVYVFPSNAPDAEDRADNTWSQDTASSTSWTADSASATTWSQD